jgi:hypothetical protein
VQWSLVVAGTVLAVAAGWILPAAAKGLRAPQSEAAPSEAAPPGTQAATSAPAAAATTPAPAATPTPAPLELRAAEVNVQSGGFVAWALMDRRTGQIWGSTNLSQTTWTASMIKAWLGADYLRRAAASGVTPDNDEMNTLEIMIRDSDNDAAQQTYEDDGESASINRMISMCHLTDSAASDEGWSFTSMSARDTVRMADCIADGTAAGTQWTPWILQMMRGVRGDGDFGIREAFPTDEQPTIAIKNGWLDYDADQSWHVNCMAVTDTWALSVLERFPDSGPDNIGFSNAEDVCTAVATQLMNPAYASAT